MSKVNFQFHATREEIIGIIKNSLYSVDIHMISVKLFPTLQLDLIAKNQVEEKLQSIHESNMIFLSPSKPDKLPDDYMEFLEYNKNSLIFTIGEQNDSILKESSISFMSKDEQIVKMWRKIINDFKKNMLKGAWVINPQNGMKEFYKNHHYTKTAQRIFQNGCKIAPSAGWTVYYLSHNI